MTQAEELPRHSPETFTAELPLWHSSSILHSTESLNHCCTDGALPLAVLQQYRGSGPQNYMAQAHAAMAGLMLAAGLTPKLQFGEILWWFLANASGMAFYDADTQAAAQAALGRALATFHTPNDDPSVKSYADANFLRTRLYNYVAAIQSYVLSQCPSATFELLWPMDVNDPDNCKLLRYINLPSQWTTRAGSGFDTFLIEGYQYPGINHNLDQATRCAQYPDRKS